MHGTGTPLGDPIEVTALGRALGTAQPRAVVLCEYVWCWAAQCMISRQATHSMFAMGSSPESNARAHLGCCMQARSRLVLATLRVLPGPMVP